MPPSRRRALHLGAVALVGSVAGCTAGIVDDESDATTETPATETNTATSTTGTRDATDPTTLPVGVDTSLPAGSVEFPDGPKSPPERPTPLTTESVRAYVYTFEYRYVYNSLHSDETSDIHETCGVDSVTEHGEGFRVVVWCSAYSNTERDGSTVHADYFTQYATYFVGPDSTVRRDGKPSN